MSAESLLDDARRVAAIASSSAEEAERLRRLPTALVDELRPTGLLRMCVPAAYGGPEVDPMTMVEAIAIVASGDGAAGWCVMIASTTSSLSVLLPAERARQLFGDRRSVTGGAYAPTGTARPAVGGGWVVDGRWSWGSGTSHCDWITGGVRTPDGATRLAWFPAAAVTLHDTWHSLGLRGTGSGDFSVDAAEVADDLLLSPGLDRPQLDTPLARFPLFTLLAAGVAGATLGIAGRAIEELVALAGGKRPAFSVRSLAAAPHTQMDVARAIAAHASARAFLLDELAAAWARATAGERVTVDQRARIRIAASNAAAQSARAVELVFHLAGGTAVFADHPLQRCLRDVNTATQHIMIGARAMENAGRHLLGVDADTSML